MADHILNHLGELLEMRNRTIRREAVEVFATHSLIDDPRVAKVIGLHLESQSWDARVSSADALAAALRHTVVGRKPPEQPKMAAASEFQLADLDILLLIKNYKPLLSACSEEFSSPSRVSSKRQRSLIDYHLELSIPTTSLSSAHFLPDAEIAGPSSSFPPAQQNDFEQGTELKTEARMPSDESSSPVKSDQESTSLETDIQRVIEHLVIEQLYRLSDARWQLRHGGALAIGKILTLIPNWLSLNILEAIAVRLLQVLSLDRFNDFASGRSATAPVREAVAQDIAHLVNHLRPSSLVPKNEENGEKFDRRKAILDGLLSQIGTLVDMDGDKLWVCRQSGLLVLKYYFAISSHAPIFDQFFEGVVRRLEDDSDELVVSSAVTALSSLFSNASIESKKKKEFVERVMTQMWKLLQFEINKENMKAGLDGLVIDLLNMVDTWMREDPDVTLDKQQLAMIRETIDPLFRIRTHTAIRILAVAVERKDCEMEVEEVYKLLHIFYRVLLFAPPTDTQVMLEEVYLATLRVLEKLKSLVQECQELRECIGMWMGCLLVDHKKGSIDVFANRICGPSSKKNHPLERLCSEEMRCVSDRDKDGIYVKRKILCAKFIAAIVQVLYESDCMIKDQKLSTALQLLFVPVLHSSSLYQNLGAALILNEWASLWKVATARIPTLEVPSTVIGKANDYVRAPTQKHFDETAVCCFALSTDCNEFIDWCHSRGVPPPIAVSATSSAEEISRLTYEACARKFAVEQNDKMMESLQIRYTLLCDQIEHTKHVVKANTARVFAFLSSSLFYFGYLGDKLTPLIRPLVEVMNGERNETVAAEVFRGSIPLLIGYSQQRQPKPYSKVLSRAIDAFASCPIRIPRPTAGKAMMSMQVISLEQLQPVKESVPPQSESLSSTSQKDETRGSSPNKDEEGDISPPILSAVANTVTVNFRSPSSSSKDSEQTVSSRNALLLLTVCTAFPIEQLPELYSNFDLDGEMDDETLLTRLDLHRALWPRVGSTLTDTATTRICNLLRSPSAELRHAGAKAVETFTASRMADTVNRLYARLLTMATNLESPTERLGAVESLLRLSFLGTPLIPIAPLLAPLAFARLSDLLPEVREAAGLAFRGLLPLLVVKRDTSVRPDGLNDDLWTRCQSNRAFVHVLSDPSRLDTLPTSSIVGLGEETQLRHYQLEGITWMSYLRRFGLSAILADDMGLGKTLQTMCAIVLANLEASNTRPSLIVAPRTLMEHWKAEWIRYFPSLKKKVILSSETASLSTMERSMIYITSYDDMKGNERLARFVWRYVVLDEGHVLRNPKTSLFRSICSLKSEARLILSGTPVQNSSADLWALFAFLIPGFLGDEKYFRSTFIKPIQQCRSPKATETQMKEGQEALGRLHRLALPFVLRRLKSDVLKELPEKVVADYECTLTELQRKVYEVIVDRCCASPTGQRALSPLHALISLRKVVDHPSLVADLADELQLTTEIREQLTGHDIRMSGKLQALSQLLAECGILKKMDDEDTEQKDNDSVSALLSSASIQKHRALIFCQWRASVSLVSAALSTGFAAPGELGIAVPHFILDGSVPADQRQALVDKFNHEMSADVLVMTTHIGGVGLNLTGADVVIFMDHDWNPMKDLQAIDRAHRLGQTRNVNVYRLITKGTIEEKVMSYQRFKKNTADALIGSENRSLSTMKTEELLKMFSLDEGSTQGGTSGGNGPPKKRKKEETKGMGAGDETWNLSEIWDESQYDESFNVATFIKEANNK